MQKEWQSFLDKLKKDNNPLYDLLRDCSICVDGNDLKLCTPNEVKKNEVKSKLGKIKAKMSPHWQNKRINVDVEIPKPTMAPRRIIPSPASKSVVKNPLQTLNFTKFGVDKKKNELAKPVLEAAVSADKTCATVYNLLTERTKKIAGANVITVKFPWRVRVGGMRGFRELLLPALHPVYGIPYITSSSLKGAILAAAKKLKLDSEAEINRILGTLEGGIGSVQILDAFPTAPCLSLDIANPQWHWQENIVTYNAVPHNLLSMEEPTILIGLTQTSRVKNSESAQNDINKVKIWLNKALSLGIGSRVSSGYGRLNSTENLPHSSSHEFELWTQGIYGAEKVEFRPVALRGMLRYWFRALALGIYSPAQCKELEATLFGTIEPKSREGSIRIAVELEKPSQQKQLFYYKGKILLGAKTPEHLTLIQYILQLSSHLGGIGRGSRRPLNWNSPRMRGCHFELNDFILPADKTVWEEFIAQVRKAFIALCSVKEAPVQINPDNPRSQDILNKQAHIYITIDQNLKHSKTVTDWENKGNTSEVRGKALNLLYGNNNFKGVNRQGIGNSEVGGKFGTPSFVIIKSNFPKQSDNYQTVTIFGVNNKARKKFVEALGADYIRVW